MKKILIVDDEPHNRILLEEILEEILEDSGEGFQEGIREDIGEDFVPAGIRLLFAGDGAETLELIQTEKPALVFLDVMLPGMDGLEVCRIIRRQPGLENIFIVILTAKSQDGDESNVLEAGADLYLAKPFKKKAVAEAAGKVFGGLRTQEKADDEKGRRYWKRVDKIEKSKTDLEKGKY
jgi:CheY-like chemotaxis protein